MSEHDADKSKGFPLKKIQEFCALHPDDPIFRVQLAERYFELGHDIRAIYVARKAHQLYLKENPKEANYLVKRHGVEVDSRKAKYLSSGRYSALSDHFGIINSSFKKIKLKESSVLYRKGDISDCFYLVLEGELAAVHSTEGKHSLLSHFRKGDIIGEHDVHHIESEEEDDDDFSDEAISAPQQTMYRGTAITVDHGSTAAEPKKKKKVMYRGAVINNDTNEKTTATKVMYRGTVVGEQNNTQAIRNVTVLVEKDCVLLKFTKDELEKALSKHPALKTQFEEEQTIHQCLANISLSSLFICLPADLRFMIARRSKVIAHKQGDNLNTSGELMPHVHLVVSGHVHLHEVVQGHGSNYCGRLGSGDVLGLEKVLNKKPNSILFKADVDCKTVQIEHAVIADVLALSKQFRSLIAQYATQNSTRTSRVMRLWNEDDNDEED